MAQLSSGFSKGFFGAAVLSLTFVAVAWAGDLVRQDGLAQDGMAPLGASQLESAGTAAAINRSAKADRAARVGNSTMQTQTVAMRLNDLANTSVLIRVPVARATPSAPASLLMKSGESKPSVACEPSVSVLTEVAKRLQPGRCVT
jgi:hypothetical protein